MKLGQQLRDMRLKRGLSQESLAEAMQVSRQTISKWERDKVRPSVENLILLSQVLHVPTDALLSDDWILPESTPDVQAVEVEVPMEVPRPPRYRLWAVILAAVFAAGILAGMLFFQDRPVGVVSWSILEGEVINQSSMGEISFIPFD